MPQVRVTSAALEVLHLSLDDPELLTAARAVVERGEDLDAWVRSPLRAGAVAIIAASSSVDTGRLTRAVDQATTKVDNTIQVALTKFEAAIAAAVDPDNGPLAIASRAVVDRLSIGVTKLMAGPNATVPETVRLAVNGVTDDALAEITRSLQATATNTQRVLTQDRDAVRKDVVDAVTGQFGHLTEVVEALWSEGGRPRRACECQVQHARQGRRL
jgi:hypothetical protein